MNKISNQNIFFFILLSLYSYNIFAGFPAGTPVKTTSGYQPIETIKSGHHLTSYDTNAGFIENRVNFSWAQATDICIVIHYLETELISNAKQQFYLPESASWVAARELKPGDKLLSAKHGHIVIDAVEQLPFAGFTHCVRFDNIHNFCVSHDDIVTHNSAGLTWKMRLWPPPTPLEIGLGVLFTVGAIVVRKIMTNFGAHEDTHGKDGVYRGNQHLADLRYQYNPETDFDNPYAYYHHKQETEGYYNPNYEHSSSFLNNDDISAHNETYTGHLHNEAIAQNIYHQKVSSTQNIPPAISIEPSVDNNALQSAQAPTQTSITTISGLNTETAYCPTTIPDPEVRKQPHGCPTPPPPTPTHTGGEQIPKHEPTIFVTPTQPPQEKPTGCYPLPWPEGTSSGLILKQEITRERPAAQGGKIKTVDDILKDAEPFTDNKKRSDQGRADIYVKPGGFDDALQDFESLGPTNIREIRNGNKGKVGDLPDGRTANVRVKSDDGRATLEIYNPVDEKSIKIRYGE